MRFKCDNDIFYSFFLVVVKNIGIDKFDLMNVGIFKNMRVKKLLKKINIVIFLILKFMIFV